jgi:hypothetical protein
MTKFALKFKIFICKVENIDKIWLFFGFFQKNEIWPYLVEFGLF